MKKALKLAWKIGSKCPGLDGVENKKVSKEGAIEVSSEKFNTTHEQIYRLILDDRKEVENTQFKVRRVMPATPVGTNTDLMIINAYLFKCIPYYDNINISHNRQLSRKKKLSPKISNKRNGTGQKCTRKRMTPTKYVKWNYPY